MGVDLIIRLVSCEYIGEPTVVSFTSAVSVSTEGSVIFQPLYEETICVWVVVVSAASPTLVVKTENCLYIYT